MSLQEWYSPQHQSKLWAVALRGGASFKGIWSLTLDTWLPTSSLATKGICHTSSHVSRSTSSGSRWPRWQGMNMASRGGGPRIA